MRHRFFILPMVTALVAVSLLAVTPSAEANHTWNGYHWARTRNPFTLKVGDNVSNTWDQYLNIAISDWSKSGPSAAVDSSTILRLQRVDGRSTSKRCAATTGQIEVCADRYGFNGWLGIAQIWISGGSHITQGTVKLNDSYFNTSTYNTPAWRNLVSCQEVGHTFGLDHQDENFNNANLGTCMDYTNNPSTNQHPNQHDYDELENIYSHTDSTTTVGQTVGTAPGRSGTAADEGPNNVADFGRPTGVKDNYGRDIYFEKDLPDGRKLFTHVFWTPNGPGNSGNGNRP